MGAESPLAGIGIMLIFIGIMFVMMSAFQSQSQGQGQGNGEVKSGGGAVIFIGPIPIAIGTDKAWAVMALIIGVILYIVLFLSRGRI